MAHASRSSKRPIEQYEHLDKDRMNNPPVGLVTPDTDKDAGKKKYQYDPHIDPSLQFDGSRSEVEDIIENGLAADNLEDARKMLMELKRRQEPYLNWAGKAEHTSFEVDTVSLHVHERISPKKIMKAVRRNGDNSGSTAEQLSLFETPRQALPFREAIRFYKHKHDWSNRLIAGDSLLVMNSLLEKEGMAGQVQMIYFDPPYGIKYGSNFQPFVNKRDVKDGKDEDLTTEPEMIKAFRDTWELGIHSYLTYIRDRLLLARELLHESGSIFIQISDKNVHMVRNILDDTFGTNNFVNLISFKTTSGFESKSLSRLGDYIIWYCKDKEKIKFRNLFEEQHLKIGHGGYNWVQLSSGERRSLLKDEREEQANIPEDARVYKAGNIKSQGKTGSPQDFVFEGRTYNPGPNHHWKTTIEGLQRLAKVGRIHTAKNSIQYIRYMGDFPFKHMTNVWLDTGTGSFLEEKSFVVQTSPKVISRCMLMSTDPGDLVFDLTCGSGTTAFVAEQWGRRWITCDTSRVAITLTKQRLMTSVFDYFKLQHPEEGVCSGFLYKKVPHITLESIANDEPPGEEVLYDQPIFDKSKIRVTGPFTVEAVPSPVVKSPSEIEEDMSQDSEDEYDKELDEPIDDSIARSGETLRQAEWRDELFKTGIRARGGRYIKFSRIEALPGTRWLHADTETKEDVPKRAVISFGPEHAPMDQRQVELALEEASHLIPKPGMVIFASFRFDPEAAKDIDEANWPGVTLLKAEMNADLFTADLKKKRTSNDSFWLVGQPDVKLEKLKGKENKDAYRVEVMGFDYYNPKTGVIESGGTQQIAMWMLDTDYDGRSLYPSQVFFPMAGPKDGWHKLAKNLKAEIDEEKIEAYRGTVSLPFKPGKNNRIAVKIIDDRGIESLKIMGVA